MIHISYSILNDRPEIIVRGEDFADTVEVLKSYSFKYDPENKVWTGSCCKVLNELENLKSEIKVFIDDETIEQMKSIINKTETTFTRAKLNRSLFKSQPLGEYQVQDVVRGISQNRLAYFLEMGLGKTWIIVNVINHRWLNGDFDKILIICPSEGLFNFRRELLRFSNLFSQDDIYIARSSDKDPFKTDKKVIIMTYITFRVVSDYWHKTLNKRNSKKYRKPPIDLSKWGTNRCIVLDESHNIKNKAAQQTHVLHLHKDFFNYRYIMTGTPAPNTFFELYSQLTFLDKYCIPETYSEYLEKLANLGNKFSKYAINYIYKDKQAIEEERLKKWVIRRRSDDYLKLPDRIIRPVYIEMGKKQKEIYEKLVESVLTVLKEQDGWLIPQKVLQKFPYMSQALDEPSLLKGKIDKNTNPVLFSLIESWDITDSAKFEMLESMLSEYIGYGEKITVFDFHPLTIDLLADRLKKYKPIVLHGQTDTNGVEKDEYRYEMIEKFKTDKKSNLLIASSRVLKTAVNITQCRRVIYYTRDADYLTWSQSQKRFHRPGQTERVMIHPFIIEESLDERTNALLCGKQKEDEELFNKNSLTMQEWQSVFKGTRYKDLI